MYNYVISIAVAELKLTKIYEVYSIAVFPKSVLLPDPFWLRKIITDSHTLTHVNMECSDDGYRRLKIHVSVLILYS
jgi:hypothetical protein